MRGQSLCDIHTSSGAGDSLAGAISGATGSIGGAVDKAGGIRRNSIEAPVTPASVAVCVAAKPLLACAQLVLSAKIAKTRACANLASSGRAKTGLGWATTAGRRASLSYFGNAVSAPRYRRGELEQR